MVICAIFGCSNHPGHGKGISFYRFPKDPDMSKRWVTICRRKDTFNVKNARICSIHFLTNDYERNLKHELLDYHPTNVRKLKDTAVPTLHLYNKNTAMGNYFHIMVCITETKRMIGCFCS